MTRRWFFGVIAAALVPPVRSCAQDTTGYLWLMSRSQARAVFDEAYALKDRQLLDVLNSA